eukprot:gnl/MRDRNA2_/MRDRNA2_197479_c0_seq1.p1 gnl/MRDRNA2_/MRDRNA2_197479_c0~~gnl/MRDRNA2_/MRDRNA2_197479_c0_seq1.p1  ORF type:complete len:579 (-),score=60.35 gnl/MRDRNA2_/MRDRNA2_197479_c0_seq1:61-1797(-)
MRVSLLSSFGTFTLVLAFTLHGIQNQLLSQSRRSESDRHLKVDVYGFSLTDATKSAQDGTGSAFAERSLSFPASVTLTHRNNAMAKESEASNQSVVQQSASASASITLPFASFILGSASNHSEIQERAVPIKGNAKSTKGGSNSDTSKTGDDSKDENESVGAEAVWNIISYMMFSSIVIYCLIANCLQLKREKEALGDQDGEMDGKLTSQGQLVSYDSKNLVSADIFFRASSYGAIFSRSKLWKQVLVYVVLCMLISCFWVSLVNVESVSNFEPRNNTSLEKLAMYLLSFMPFFLAMYVGTTFNRWWTIRTQGLGVLWNSATHLAVLTVTHLPDDKFKVHQDKIIRYTTLTNRLIWQQCRNELDIETLAQHGLLTEAERQDLEEAKGPKPFVVWVWIAELFATLYQQKDIDWLLFVRADEQISNARQGIRTCLTHVKVQIPYVWPHLMSFMVHTAVLCNVFRMGAMTSATLLRIHNRISSGRGGCRFHGFGYVCTPEAVNDWLTIACNILRVLSSTFIYLGFLQLTSGLMNPFGKETWDFPMEAYVQAVESEQTSACKSALKRLGSKMEVVAKSNEKA